MDYGRHNEEVRQVWASYEAGTPLRVPVILGVNPRIWLLDPRRNREGITFRQYSEDPAVMARVQMATAWCLRSELPADHEMGLPEGWSVYVDVQNYYEAAWLGCRVIYPQENCPTSVPMTRDALERRMGAGFPSLTDGFYGEKLALWERLRELVGREGYLGVPIREAHGPGTGTDGPLTVACNLLGTEAFLTALLEDEDFSDAVLAYVADAAVYRIRALRRLYGQPERSGETWLADDSCALLSTALYERRILPLHRRIFDALTIPGGVRGIHLCGDATRHFPLIRDALGVTAFDTGYPVAFGALQRVLGSEVRINGGPAASLLLGGTPAQVGAEAARILREVRPLTRRFVLREGNNLCPRTPPENVAALYEAARTVGRYDAIG